MLRQLPFEYAFRNLGRSPVRLAASLLGATLVVLLVLASAGFVRGMQLTLTNQAGLYQNVILLGAGSEEAIERSQIDAGIAQPSSGSVPLSKHTRQVMLVGSHTSSPQCDDSVHSTHIVPAVPSPLAPAHTGSIASSQPASGVPAVSTQGTHAKLSVSHTGVPPEQSVSSVHSTHVIDVVSQAGVAPMQSASSAQPGVHIPLGLQNVPAAQSSEVRHSRQTTARRCSNGRRASLRWAGARRRLRAQPTCCATRKRRGVRTSSTCGTRRACCASVYAARARACTDRRSWATTR